MADKVLATNSETKKEETWSQTIKRGDITSSIRVEKLDNTGYLVTIEKYGYSKKDSKHEHYINETTKLYSLTNPLDNDETDDPIMKAAALLTRN